MQSILGQDKPIEILSAALAGERAHHAWLFHGPIGVGKFTTALAFAKILLCHNPQNDLTGNITACDNCKSCHLLNSQNTAHPDLHIIVKELAQISLNPLLRTRKLINIPIDLLRELMVGGYIGSSDNKKFIDPLAAKTPILHHNKVFIIDEAELLAHGQNETQNSLLKTLEEPPPDTYIILVTSDEDRLLPTIRSRCHRLRFSLLSDDIITQWITKYLSNTDTPNLSNDQLANTLLFANNSIGLAKLAIDYHLYDWPLQINPMLNAIEQGKHPYDLGPTMTQLTNSFAQLWVDNKNNKNASKDAANKNAVRHMLTLLGHLCRQQIASIPSSPHNLDKSKDQLELQLKPWLTGIDLIQNADSQLLSNVSPALLLDNLAVQWSLWNKD